MNIFEKWNKSVDMEGLKADISEADQGNRDFDEVPKGTYEVKINKMELKESSKGQPMLSIWFKIIAGDYKGQMIFMNQVINQGFQISIAKRFLLSLDAVDESEITFEDYGQFNQLVLDVFEGAGELEYLLEYGQNKNGFNTFKIMEVYD